MTVKKKKKEEKTEIYSYITIRIFEEYNMSSRSETWIYGSMLPGKRSVQNIRIFAAAEREQLPSKYSLLVRPFSSA